MEISEKVGKVWNFVNFLLSWQVILLRGVGRKLLFNIYMFIMFCICVYKNIFLLP